MAESHPHEPIPGDASASFTHRPYVFIDAYNDRGFRFLLSPDMEILATFSGGMPLQLWRVGDGAHLCTIETGFLFSVAFSPNGQLLATGIEKEVCLYRIADGTLIQCFRVSSDYPGCVLFSPDGQLLASTLGLFYVWIWRVDDGALVHKLVALPPGQDDHTRHFIPLAFSPDGCLLAVGEVAWGNVAREDASHVLLWRVADGVLLEMFTGYLPDVAEVAFSSDGTLLAARSADGAMRTWRIREEGIVAAARADGSRK